jgi:hypothetical protein
VAVAGHNHHIADMAIPTPQPFNIVVAPCDKAPNHFEWTIYEHGELWGISGRSFASVDEATKQAKMAFNTMHAQLEPRDDRWLERP